MALKWKKSNIFGVQNSNDQNQTIRTTVGAGRQHLFLKNIINGGRTLFRKNWWAVPALFNILKRFYIKIKNSTLLFIKMFGYNLFTLFKLVLHYKMSWNAYTLFRFVGGVEVIAPKWEGGGGGCCLHSKMGGVGGGAEKWGDHLRPKVARFWAPPLKVFFWQLPLVLKNKI